MTSRVPPATESLASAADRLVDVRTPYGRPVDWAEVAMVSDIGDSHELNDDRCLVISSRELGERPDGPLGDYLLCLLADGATGSSFAPDHVTAPEASRVQAGWRASQLAQAAFVERFLASHEVDVMDRLREGLRAADRVLVDSVEGTLSTTLTALFVAADGTACAASIGDSVLLVLPPNRKTPGERRLKKLGYEDTTAVGSGDTTLSYVDESELIEHWWRGKDDGRAQTRVELGTYFVLASDGISDNLPAEVIDQLLHRHRLDRATVALPRHTRARRAQTQRSAGGSTTQLGLDNMSAIVVRFDGRRRWAAAPRLDGASLVTVLGTHGGPRPNSGGPFGLVCLAGHEALLDNAVLPRFLRGFLESEHTASTDQRLDRAFERAFEPAAEHQSAVRPSTLAQDGSQVRLCALALDEAGHSVTFSSSGLALESLLDVRLGRRTVAPAHDSALQKFIYSPRLWASSLAALGLLVLVSTAFATGTVRPAPPPVPTLKPGEPTPTPDTRPMLSIGGFQLMPPAAEPTPTPPAVTRVVLSGSEASLVARGDAGDAPAEPAAPAPSRPEECSNPFGLLCGTAPPAQPARRSGPRSGGLAPTNQPARPATPEQPSAPDQPGAPAVSDTRQPDQPESPSATEQAPVQPSPSCTNFLGIGCPSAPPARPGPSGVVPGPSPVPVNGEAPPGPRPGSNLDLALKIASVANDQFNSSLEDPSSERQQARR